MTETIKDTEHLLKLSGYFGRRRAFLTGRDTTALMLLIEELTPPDGRVVLSAISCMTRLAAVLRTGRTPVIVDVDDNLNMDPMALCKAVRSSDLVFATHIFGIPCQIDDIMEICEDSNATLIEDASQAIGGKIDGKPIGSFGVASLLSFADRKILPTIGGGALVTDDRSLFNKLELAVAELPERPDDYMDRKKGFQGKALDAFKLVRAGDVSKAADWYSYYEESGEIYKFSATDEEAQTITDAIPEFETTVRDRREMAYLLKKNMVHAPVKILDYPIQSAPFRFTFVLPEELDGNFTEELTGKLRDAGLDVNNLYIPLHWLAPDKVVTAGCPKAEIAGTRMINLRIDDSTTRAQANLAGELVGTLVKVES